MQQMEQNTRDVFECRALHHVYLATHPVISRYIQNLFSIFLFKKITKLETIVESKSFSFSILQCNTHYGLKFGNFLGNISIFVSM